jgi:hypothetical protein
MYKDFPWIASACKDIGISARVSQQLFCNAYIWISQLLQQQIQLESTDTP